MRNSAKEFYSHEFHKIIVDVIASWAKIMLKVYRHAMLG